MVCHFPHLQPQLKEYSLFGSSYRADSLHFMDCLFSLPLTFSLTVLSSGVRLVSIRLRQSTLQLIATCWRELLAVAAWKQTLLKRVIVPCVTCHHSPSDINGLKAWWLVQRRADGWTLLWCTVHVYRESDWGRSNRRKIEIKGLLKYDIMIGALSSGQLVCFCPVLHLSLWDFDGCDRIILVVSLKNN